MSRVETYDGPAWRLISTLCGESATRNLANHSMRIQGVYVGTVPIPQFIKKKSVAPRRLTLRCPGPRPIPCCCLSASHRWEVLRTVRSCAPALPPLLPQAAASRVASLLLACLPPRPCPEARLRAPRCCSPSTGQVTEIEWAWIPVRPSVPPPHPVPASMSVGRRRTRGFPPGQSPSPLVGPGRGPPADARVVCGPSGQRIQSDIFDGEIYLTDSFVIGFNIQ